ncbi:MULTISPECIES: hypothetical protein [unclassified Variovorax]|uniref:hypothetical protein n=1 Tax=unclassified Variovorax TaxID=663243 RepID=UPI0025751BA7|nr:MULTISPECIES: hypothetical protein [unclassified Variovorax]MDM0088038.1 hypothetical protein [Variovorax sp. J22G40]MDM0146111.1 hypothetical protein [Variovorax sp. J2P1-31]
MKTNIRSIPLRRVGASLLLLAALAGCGNDAARFPNHENFTATVNDYLAQRGHVCLAKYSWPITVPAGSHEPDAQQMPVLEKLGLVRGKDVAAAREYALTDAGRQHYLQVPVVVRTTTQTLTHPADLCAATLSLDRLIGWDPPQTRDGRTATSLLFTYRIATDAWATAPEVQQAFPLLARAIQREGTMQVRLGVHLTRSGWVADELDVH